MLYEYSKFFHRLSDLQKHQLEPGPRYLCNKSIWENWKKRKSNYETIKNFKKSKKLKKTQKFWITFLELNFFHKHLPKVWSALTIYPLLDRSKDPNGKKIYKSVLSDRLTKAPGPVFSLNWIFRHFYFFVRLEFWIVRPPKQGSA